MIKKCPVCNASISLWEIAKSGLKPEGGPVICKRCNSTISKPWKNYLWVLPLGFLWGYFIDYYLSNYFMFSTWLLIILELAIIFFTCLVALLIFPLSKQKE